MKNPIHWLEIATIDLERAKNFYATVFKLDFQYIEMPGTKMFMFGSSDLLGTSGCLVHSEENNPSADGTIVYFACDDVGVEAARVEAAGGKLLVPKTDIGDFGFFAQLMDTEGNRIGLHSNK